MKLLNHSLFETTSAFQFLGFRPLNLPDKGAGNGASDSSSRAPLCDVDLNDPRGRRLTLEERPRSGPRRELADTFFGVLRGLGTWMVAFLAIFVLIQIAT